jgi:hypothetical protein
MRRTLLVLTVALVMAAMVAASALPVAAQGEGETGIQEDGRCFLDEPGVPSLDTDDRHAVITPSGNTKLTCHFEGDAIAQTTVGKGFPCSTPLDETTQSHYVYTKSGNATLTCLFKPPAVRALA